MINQEILDKYETTIGLEIHVQLDTKTKMFCRCDNNSEGAEPNTHVCPICMGYPGTLPVMNEQAIKFGVLLAKSLGCEINKFQRFDRKNYFYPDLPKGYQISQFFFPVGEQGTMTVDYLAPDRKTKKEFTVGITRLHLEEDAGKLTHSADSSLVDLNRCGTPLAEIVTGPDFHSPEEAKAFMQELQRIVRALHVSSADLEKGHLRVDGNISVRPHGQKELGSKVEIKNINSFKFLEAALKFEVERQIAAVEAGEIIVQETRGWDEKTNSTLSQRIKEGSVDYRYFPEPDLPPLQLTDDWINTETASAVLLPRELREKALQMLGGNYGRVGELQDVDKLEKFVLLAGELGSDYDALAVTLIVGKDFATGEEARSYFTDLAEQAKQRAAEWGDADKLKEIASGILADNAALVERYRAGETKLLDVLIGQMMGKTKGQAEPALVQQILRDLLTK